jgi:DNA-binding CsgD family transcriptional regulator
MIQCCIKTMRILNNSRVFHFVLFFLCAVSHAQIIDIGIPFIVNHTRSTYNASPQNWSITQNEKGFVYFGNNDGILEYDGRNWNVFGLPNNSVVRSVFSDGDTIYAGAFEELGFLAPSPGGYLEYHSLVHLIPEGYTDFDEVWKIFRAGEKIIFQSFKYIFSYNNGAISVIEPVSNLSLMHLAGGQFYVVDNETGLMLFQDNRLSLISDHPVFFRNEVRSILPLDCGQILIGTSNEGVFILEGNRLAPWKVDVNEFLKQHMLFSAILLGNGNLVWGSLSNGIYITNQEGEILQHVNRYKGLQNNTVLSLFEDNRKNLWVGLDNGIDLIEITSPLSQINFNYNIEAVYASLIHDNILYVGTNQGLYALEAGKINNSGNDISRFRLVRGTEGQVWNLTVIDGTLFCGHNFGCFEVKGFDARKISDIRGYWEFVEAPFLENNIIAGTYSGLVQLKRVNNKWEAVHQIRGFRESSRRLFFDHLDNLWISHGYRGLFKLVLSDDLDSVMHVQLFKGIHGLPERLPYNIQSIENEMYVTTHEGIFSFDYGTQSFYQPGEINNLFAGKGFVDRIYEDHQKNLWYFTGNYMGVMRLLEDGKYSDITAPFSGINMNLLYAFQNIYISENNQAWIGTWNGLILYNSGIFKNYKYNEEVFVKEALFYGRNDSIVLNYIDRAFQQNGQNRFVMPFRQNSVILRFTLPAYENPERIRFSYRLTGFSNQWSDWDVFDFKEYTNLREGTYVFEVRGMNAFGNESQVKTVEFTILPPFIRSGTAYVGYSAMILIIIAVTFYFVRKRILRIRLREITRHEKRLARQEKIFREQSVLNEKEIVQLRNERLKSEMHHKNMELANATLHLIQKNKTLTSLRNDLDRHLKNNNGDSPYTYFLRDLIKKINRDIRNEKHWELFNSYFDEVHQDFINRLKDKYNDLSPKELRLCSYLRMNISTKEIAPLMNISVRGVEISRYRLRKKLDLEMNTNLTDFLISF